MEVLMVGKNATKKVQGFSDEEKVAMRERARELRVQANKTDGEAAILEKISQMAEPDKSMAKRVHELITKNAPSLTPRTWYGMPAYANAEGTVICFFQNAGKFQARYQTLGFNNKAKLDDGNMWATSYALTKLTASEEAKIVALVKKAVG